jgi:hypothetical protein
MVPAALRFSCGNQNPPFPTPDSRKAPAASNAHTPQHLLAIRGGGGNDLTSFPPRRVCGPPSPDSTNSVSDVLGTLQHRLQ